MASSLPTDVGHWETLGAMAIGQFAPRHPVPLPDGSAVVVGNDACRRDPFGCSCERCVRDDSVATETWDPSTNSWSVASLDKPRAEFVAVPLADGRVLVTGGSMRASRMKMDTRATISRTRAPTSTTQRIRARVGPRRRSWAPPGLIRWRPSCLTVGCSWQGATT